MAKTSERHLPIPSVFGDALATIGLSLENLRTDNDTLTELLCDNFPPEQRTVAKKTTNCATGLFAAVDVKTRCPVLSEKCMVWMPWYTVIGYDALGKFKPPKDFPVCLYRAIYWRLLAEILLTGNEELLRNNYCKFKLQYEEYQGAAEFVQWWNACPERKTHRGNVMREKNASTLASRVHANMITLGVESLAYYYGVALAPTVAKVNHACQPNCVLSTIDDTVILVALRDISAGEELTRAYVPFAGDRYLKEWDVCVHNSASLLRQFKCMCAVCRHGPQGSCRSVANLELLEELNSKLDTVKLADKMDLVEKSWETLESAMDPPSDLVGAPWSEDEKRMKLATVARYLHVAYDYAIQMLREETHYVDSLAMRGESLVHIAAIDWGCRPELRLFGTELIMWRFMEYLVTEKDASGDFEGRFLCTCVEELGLIETTAITRVMPF